MGTKDIREILGNFDSLYHGVICPLFEKIGDKRADNSSYKLVGALKSSFAITLLNFLLYFPFGKRLSSRSI